MASGKLSTLAVTVSSVESVTGVGLDVAHATNSGNINITPITRSSGFTRFIAPPQGRYMIRSQVLGWAGPRVASWIVRPHEHAT